MGASLLRPLRDRLCRAGRLYSCRPGLFCLLLFEVGVKKQVCYCISDASIGRLYASFCKPHHKARHLCDTGRVDENITALPNQWKPKYFISSKAVRTSFTETIEWVLIDSFLIKNLQAIFEVLLVESHRSVASVTEKWSDHPHAEQIPPPPNPKASDCSTHCYEGVLGRDRDKSGSSGQTRGNAEIVGQIPSTLSTHTTAARILVYTSLRDLWL
jgi:hypothetical protein